MFWRSSRECGVAEQELCESWEKVMRCAEVLTEEYKVEVRPHQGLDQNLRPALEPSAREAAEPKVRELQPTDV